MRSKRGKTPRALAAGIAFLVLTFCLATAAVNTVFAAPLPASSQQAATSGYTPAPANTAVTTYKGDNGHTGDQTNETILNTSNVNSSSFGRKVSYPVDAQVYAQPLYVPNLTIGGSTHNVVFVETEHDSVYAFDADQTSATAPLWHTSFINPPGTISPSNTDLNCNDLIPEDGLSGTPVIDTSTNTMYVVALTEDTTNGTYSYNLHALSLTTGQDETGSPIKITASVSSTSGVDASGGKITFNARTERQRAGLVLANGNIYIAWGSFCDHNPYHGWLMSYSYNGTSFSQKAAISTTPNGTQGGLWAAGGAIVADSAGNIYYVSGNGNYNGTTDFGDSFVKLSSSLKVEDYFTPFNQQCLDAEDADLGSGGPLLIPGQNRMLGAGKEGRIYVVDTTNMGKYTNPYSSTTVCSNQSKTNIDKVVEELPQTTIGGLYSSAAYWQNASGQEFIYYAGANDTIKAFTFSGGKISTSPFSAGPENFSFTGGNPTVSSNAGAAGTGIVWTLSPQGASTSQVAVLRAYDATNLSHELYSNSNTASAGYVKFSAPTVANGEVFIGTKSSLEIYGEIQSSGTPTSSPTPTGSPDPNASAYNNAGISYDNQPTAANYDGVGNSYSESAFNADGILPGGLVTAVGYVFRWPGTSIGTADNFVANGETIAVKPVPHADHMAFIGSATNGTAYGTLTVAYTDGTSQTFTLGFNDWAAKGVKTLQYGDQVIATMSYRNTPTGQQALAMNLYMTTIPLNASKTVMNITLPAVVSGGRMHVFAIATSSLTSPIYNSVCIQEDGLPNPGATSDNGNLSPVNCDGGGYGYSATALQNAGLVPGNTVTSNGFTWNWPDVTANESDNYQADGQTLPITPVDKAATMAFLGAATNGSVSGTGTITYTDGTTQNFTLGFTDWASKTVAFGNKVVATMPYRDNSAGTKQTLTMYLFEASVALQTGKTVQSVTLPNLTGKAQIHVFDITTSSPTAAVYNNAGIADDQHVTGANFDGGGRSYSGQQLQTVGANPGDNTFDPNHLVTFTWPLPAYGSPDNYVCTGQILTVENPQNNANVLGFLGSSSNGAASGTITVTYTDGTTQNFTLGFDDWTLNGGKTQKLSYTNEAISYTLQYRDNPAKANGQEAVKTYIFYNYVSIDPTKVVASVTLPSSTTGGQMHIFAVSTAAL